MKTKFLAALAATTALAVAGCGSSNDTPTTTAKAVGNGVDRAFVAAMIPHHHSAVAMAKIARTRGTSTFVTTLAENIVRTQTAEITQMRSADARLAKAGVKTSDLGVSHSMMGMSMDTTTLKTATPFDPAFLKMMVPHHEGAVTMAKAELARGSDSRLRTLARSIIATQTREIAQMRAHGA